MSKITNILSVILMVLVFASTAPGLIKSIKKQYQESLKAHVKVAKIKITSDIKDLSEQSKQITKHFKDPEIKAILLEIDSPGGCAGTSKAFFNEIQLLKKEYPKPIVSLSQKCCASGAYYIASVSDYIIASSTSIVGSIGVTVGFFNISNVLKKYDVSYIDKHSGTYKTAGTPYLPNNPEQELMLQELSDNIYSQFTSDVASCRKLALSEIDKWANGRIFSGEQALKLKLIDETGSEYNAIKKIRELALIKDEEEITWVSEKEPNLIAKFLNGKTQTNLSPDAIIDTVINRLESRFISCN